MDNWFWQNCHFCDCALEFKHKVKNITCQKNHIKRNDCLIHSFSSEFKCSCNFVKWKTEDRTFVKCFSFPTKDSKFLPQYLLEDSGALFSGLPLSGSFPGLASSNNKELWSYFLSIYNTPSTTVGPSHISLSEPVSNPERLQIKKFSGRVYHVQQMERAFRMAKTQWHRSEKQLPLFFIESIFHIPRPKK